MINRRKFLKKSIKIPIVGLSLLALSGCESERDKLINQLQKSAENIVPYTDGKGYVYKVDVDEEEIEVSLDKYSSHYDHSNHKNRLNYTVGETNIKVHGGGEIEVWYKGTLVENTKRVQDAQILTDRVLLAVGQKNGAIKIEASFQSGKDLN